MRLTSRARERPLLEVDDIAPQRIPFEPLEDSKDVLILKLPHVKPGHEQIARLKQVGVLAWLR